MTDKSKWVQQLGAANLLWGHDANGSPVQSPGRKDDAGKPDMTLLPYGPLAAVARVLEFGASKYARGAWMRVANAETRYCAAALRHVFAHVGGERLDPESGLPHLAHAAASILFALHFVGKASDASSVDSSKETP